ncbi:HD-GYP domain-containing protein [Neptunomonas antarctica]|uniref:HD domain-containing protein n=1 Tax=Neptunomonas antarctica TaxID=619304 RepID=A0A1N7L3Q8_9GAMM|nr:HD-GYP domain-containing protein [Neptunomonas antarctica]SIS68320.1 HD domain-containing protein [Neptunomonas antarctica]
MSLFNNISRFFDNGVAEKTNVHEDLLRSLLVMAWMVEARDPYTGGHLWRVSRFSHLLASESGLPDADVARIALGGFLHDLGKIGVPDHILNKTGKLTDEEYAVIKTHPEVGWRTLAGHPLAGLAEVAIRSHHETPNGKGYPKGLSGSDIPVDARIVGICDAFDAMTSTRPYRREMPIKKALAIIEENLGSQFDRDFGERFLALGAADQLDHIVGHSDAGIPLHECVMCGPTLVLRKGQVAGEHVYCRNCTGEYLVEDKEGLLVTTPTQRMGSAEDLEPEVDTDLIARVVRESARALLL